MLASSGGRSRTRRRGDRRLASTLLLREGLRPRNNRPDVAIVSTNRETLDGLEAYLRAAGLTTRGTRELEEIAHLSPSARTAIVLFPDDFRWELVVATLAELTAVRRKPSALPVLVTANPKRFELLVLGQPALIVPRPAWGWTILDAIRSRVDGGDAGRPRARESA